MKRVKTESLDHYGLVMGMIKELGIIDVVDKTVPINDWIEQYYLPNRPSDIEPMIISREITDKLSQSYQDLINGFNNFNAQNNILKLRYIEFSIDCTQNTINFNEITYNHELCRFKI